MASGVIANNIPTVIVDNTSGNKQDFDKTNTVSGVGVIVVFAGSVNVANDYGSWSVQIYHNDTLIMAEGTRWGTALSQPKGASAGVPISVSSGDEIRVRVINTIADSISVFRRFLCFGGCSVS